MSERKLAGRGEHPGAAASTLAELLQTRALESPDSRVFTFLTDGEREAATLTFGELHRRALTIAARLGRVARPGAHALLLYPPGLNYISAFFGCLYAGVVAVPLYPPDPSRARRLLPRLLSVVADAEPELALTTHEVVEQGGLDGMLPPSVRVIATDAPDGDGDAPVSHEALPSDVALLQYTSGSTSAPRGVMLTHANMLANAAIQRRAWRLGPESVGVSWLPLYHDLGVISCLVQPLYAGFHTVMMPPSALLQRPARWLRAISHYRGTFAGGPSFVFDLCVQNTSPEEREALDLSSWRCAFNGAEPIRAETLAAFTRTFAPFGFDPGAMYPCYGMAEANFISGGLSPREPLVSRFRSATVTHGRSDLIPAGPAGPAGENDATTGLVGCGQIQDGQRVLVVDPETRAPCADGRVGEIWVSGPSVGLGYFRREAETEATFQARVAGTNEGPFLRTGDLGAFVADELYVAGRLKDLIIVRGVNHYPQDIELTAEHAHPAVRPGCGAAFSVDVEGEEQLVVVSEVVAGAGALDADAVFSAVRRAVIEAHDLSMHAMVLLAPGSIAKTTSGKIQRSACRAAFLDGTLTPLVQWRRADAAPATATHVPPANGAAGGPARSVAEIRAWLVAQIAARLRIDPRRVDPAEPFVSYGMDSRETVGLSGDLETWLGRRVSSTVAYAHPNVAALAHHLAGHAAKAPDTAPGPATVADPAEPVAIVGVGCRFPGAPDPEGYWRLLRDGVDAIREVPPDRWDARAYYDADPSVPGMMNSRWGGFLDQIDRFDPLFFGISPHEAAHMDPQQRLLLEVAWEAMEDAGMPPSGVAGAPVGVFVGVTTDDYGRLQMRDADRIGAYSATGSLHCIAANRVSYAFDFRGPSVAVDTACSASLVAIHYACQALRSGEATAALAGGVNVIISPENTVSQARLGILAADGRCKTFDARADGIVRSEGAGIVVLKTLSRAVADGDRIYAVILGSAVNQDGRSNGLTAPNPEAQVALLREAYRRAGVSPGSVSYVEAHGTGTQLGDPIEARALGSVLAEGRAEGDRCAIGSVKTNVGHLEAAAGVAGLIKVALSLHHGAIPPSLHFQSANPHIPLDELPLRVQTALAGWPAARSSIAGVSSFGIGGTNAHVVLSAAPPAAHQPDGARPSSAAGAHLLPLSARSPEALHALTRAHAADLSDPAGQDPRALADRCYTAGVRREHHEHRAAFVARTGEELRDRLDAFARGDSAPGVSAGRANPGRRVAFVFSGQGSQRPGAGRELMACEPAFREAVERCDGALAPTLGWSVAEQILRPGAEALSDRNDVVQPLMFTLQVALAALWRAWGVEPDAVIGHSMGEVAAAHVAGALTLDQAARVIVERSRELMRVWGEGTMLLVGLSAEDAAREAAAYPGRMHVAVLNGPRSTGLSGDKDAVRELQAALESRDVFCHPVKTGCAAHSPPMDPLAASLRATLEAMAPSAPARTFYSTVWSGAGVLDAGYWADNLRQPVRFYPAVQTMLADGFDLFVELSPHPALGSSVAMAMESAGVHGTVLGSLRRDEGEAAAMRASLGGLYAVGRGVRFDQVSPTNARLATLPGYPFQRQRCWFDPAPRARRDDDSSSARVHPLLGRAVPLASSPGAVVWENRVSFATAPFVPEHGFQGAVVFNSFAYLEAALAAARVSVPQGALRVEDAEFRKVMFVPEDGAREVQWHVAPDGAGFSFQVYGRDADDVGATWVLHAVARVSRDETDGEHTDLAALRTRCGSTMAGEEVYAGLESFGENLGPRFRGLVRAHIGDGEALGEIVTPEGLADESGPYAFHPALLDACAHTLVTASPEQRAFMPVKVGSVRVFRRPPRVLWSHARVSSPRADTGEAGLCGEVRVYDSDGAPVAEILGIELRYLDRVQAPAARPSRRRMHTGGDRVAVARMAPEARAAHVRAYLAAAVADVLRLESPVSDAGAALDAMGLDSLMAVELKRRIAVDLGAAVPIVSFLRHASLTELGDLVLRVLDSAEPTPSGMFTVVDASASPRDSADASRPALDLTSEVVLDDAVRVNPGLRAPQGPPEQPLLTGVTGYLGAFLLADLLRASEGEVRCLVRAPNVAAGHDRIQRALARRGLWEPSFAGRVVPVTGDLAQPRLGLAPREFDALADAVDAVYHSGALVNFLFPYEDVRATNVGGTAEILRLATRGAVKPVHFVSSLSVFFTAQYAGVTVSESETPEHAEHLPLQGYAQSKWVADRLISLARERGIPATIYRPVFIGWHARTGEYNPDDFLCRFIQACVLLGAAPEIDMDLMIAPVDYVSAATVALSRRADAAGKNYHLTHAVRVTWSDLLEWLGETRHRVARVPYASWRERLVAAAASESGKAALRTLVPLFPPVEMDASVTELMSARRAPVFDSVATRTDLAPSGIACPAMDASLLGVFVEKLTRDLEDRRVSGANGAPARLPRYARGSLSAPLTHRADLATGALGPLTPLAPLAPLGGGGETLTVGDELAQAADLDRGENFG